MAYLIIENFAAGIDLRRDAVTAPPGSLRALDNAFVNAGGEVEKRQTLTGIGTLPTGLTHGLAASGSGLVVFGTVTPATVGTLPDNVTYQELDEAGDGETIDQIIDVESFGTQLYVVARFTDGEYRHFLDGTRVPALQVAGTNVRAHKSKMYSCDGRNVRFSAILDAADWTVGAGFGIIDLNSQDTGDVNLVGMEEYYGSLALFGRSTIQIWLMDADPLVNTKQQTLGNIGLVAPHAAARVRQRRRVVPVRHRHPVPAGAQQLQRCRAGRPRRSGGRSDQAPPGDAHTRQRGEYPSDCGPPDRPLLADLGHQGRCAGAVPEL